MSRACFQDGSMLLKMWVWRRGRCMMFSYTVRQMFRWSACDSVAYPFKPLLLLLQLFRWMHYIPVFQPHGKLCRFCRSQYPCSFSSWDKKRRICLKLRGCWIQHIWEWHGWVDCLVPSMNSSGALHVSPSSASGLSCLEGGASELIKLSVQV